MLQIIMFTVSAVLVIVDQATKFLAVHFLKGQPSVPIWPDVFELQYAENPGIAFSMLENQRWIFIPTTCLVIILLSVMMLRSDLRHYKMFSLSCAMILAGGIGNLIDRIAYQYVVDFLYFKLIDFPIFNFADCCVVVGAILLFVFLLFVYKESDAGTIRGMIFGSKPAGKEKSHGRNTDMDDPDRPEE